MAWIESHQELERHPKTLKLMSLMGWSLDETIGKLQRFWWWCMSFAEDGTLQKYDAQVIANAVDIKPDNAEDFLDSMIKSGWIDQDPILRVHNWYRYYGKFLKIKYKNYPEKLQSISEFYIEGSKGNAKGTPKPTIPNPTIPNHTNKTEASPALQAVLNKMAGRKVNIYQLVKKYKQKFKLRVDIPEEVIIDVCEDVIRRENEINDIWPWFMTVLKRKLDKYFSEKNVEEGEKFKKENSRTRGISGPIQISDILSLSQDRD